MREGDTVLRILAYPIHRPGSAEEPQLQEMQVSWPRVYEMGELAPPFVVTRMVERYLPLLLPITTCGGRESWS